MSTQDQTQPVRPCAPIAGVYSTTVPVPADKEYQYGK